MRRLLKEHCENGLGARQRSLVAKAPVAFITLERIDKVVLTKMYLQVILISTKDGDTMKILKLTAEQSKEYRERFKKAQKANEKRNDALKRGATYETRLDLSDDSRHTVLKEPKKL